jgi:hypothetical protein
VAGDDRDGVQAGGEDGEEPVVVELVEGVLGEGLLTLEDGSPRLEQIGGEAGFVARVGHEAVTSAA